MPIIKSKDKKVKETPKKQSRLLSGAIGKLSKGVKRKPLAKQQETFEPMYLYIIIVDYGQGEPIIKMMQNVGSSVQFSYLGNGTANRQVLEVLGMQDNRKDIVFSFVRESLIEDVKKEFNAFLLASKRNRGIGFSMKLTSLVGEKMFHFLSNTL